MKTTVCNEKLMTLIREVQARKAQDPPAAKKSWREIVGTSSGDAADQEAARMGEAWRRSEGQSG